jgi:signal transduction histidine kinase/CheY-like chemotaxis protein
MVLQADLIRVVQRLSFCLDMEGVMAVLRECARELTGADGVTIVLRDGDLCHYVEENAIEPLWKGRRFPLDTCISGWCMLHRQQTVIPDIYADSRIPHAAYRPTFVKSLAMTPIRQEDPIGAIGAYWAGHHLATDDELRVLQALADSAAMAIANARMVEQLQDANRRKDEFLSMLAHELRSPLGPIRNALHVLRHYIGDGDGDGGTAERTWALMDRQMQLLARIVDDLLDVARITGGKVALQRERLDLAQVVRRSVEDRRGLLEAAGLGLDLELPPAPVWVQGDSLRLSQALGNLLENAGKFTPTGGRVTVRLEGTGGSPGQAGEAVVTVRDTGIGIEPGMLPHVFEVFAQAHQSLDRSQGGLGLGLPAARGLAELHGGTLQAASDGAGQGAEFTLRLPQEEELPAPAQDPPPSAADPQSLRILVVEDNQDTAESLRIFLEIYGYGVTLAYTGPAGVEAAKALQPDVVLCDIGLPGMNGFEVAKTLRRAPETATARLIAVTGYGQEEDRRRSLEAGFDVHLVKPVDPQKLLEYLA